jgi:signal transduction histidine kinase/DNA-binding response OmpR family regulator
MRGDPSRSICPKGRMSPLEIPIASTLFLLLFLGSLIGFVVTRNPLTGMVALVFAATAPIFIIRFISTLFDVSVPAPLTLAAIAGLLAQPVLTLGLAGMVHRVPRIVLLLALVGYLLTTALVLLLLTNPLPLWATAAALINYTATAVVAALFFVRAARRRIGSARARLLIAAGATLLMAAALVVAGAGAAMETESTVLPLVGRWAVFLAALGFTLAFLVPSWLARPWQAPTAFSLSRKLLEESGESDASVTWHRFAELAAQASGARSAAVLVGHPDRGARLVAELGDVGGADRAWDEQAFRKLAALGDRTHEVPSDRAGPEVAAVVGVRPARFTTLLGFNGPRGERGLVILVDDHRTLFARDDRETVETLGVQAGLLADRATSTAQHAALAERLAETVDALRAASQAKSDFLASMSHELRTPLNAILGFSDLMRGEPGSGGRRRVPDDWIDHIHVAGEHLLELINDVLDLAKVEAGRLELQMETVDSSAAVSEALAGLRPLAQRKHVTLSAKVDLPPIVADRGRLRQILYNLLSNAIKFTPEGGEVRVDGTVDGPNVRLSVIDTGIGIAAGDQERVFEEFMQVGAPEARQIGTGLGLALTRRLAEAHGGHIELQSVVGAGSRFTVVLPAGLREDPAVGHLEPQVPTDAEPVMTAGQATTEGQTTTEGQAVAATQTVTESQAASRHEVLIIEDDPQAVALLGVYLEPAGYSVRRERDGVGGLAAAHDRRPVAILLDVMLPGLDGWEVLRRLKADPELRAIPVLMITVVEQREVGLALGAADYLVKPVERAVLLEALRRHVPGLTSGPSRRVLAIDDEPSARAFVKATLETLGCEVVLASGGREGVEAARGGGFDLIICDLVMPDLDGFEVVARLKASDATRDTPILILTGQALDQNDKDRLNGQIVGISEKGEDAATHLRSWLQRVGSRGTGADDG